MNKRTIFPVTLALIVGLYVGCTNPGTISQVKNTIDPRVPAGNATGTSTSATWSKDNVTGYWLVSPQPNQQNSPDNQITHMAVRQNADGSFIGETDDTGRITDGKNANGNLTFSQSGEYTWTGTVTEDGATASLSRVVGGTTTLYTATRLF